MKLPKNQIQNPGSNLGVGGGHIPAEFWWPRHRCWGPGCRFWLPSLGSKVLVSPFCGDGVWLQATFPCTYWGALQWAPFSFPGCLALEFLELSIVEFLSLQDQWGRRERWKPRERGQLCSETCHQVNKRPGDRWKGKWTTSEASAQVSEPLSPGNSYFLPSLREKSDFSASHWTAHTPFSHSVPCAWG